MYDLHQLREATWRMEHKVEKKQRDFFNLVNELVAWRQECRMNKDYATADRIRSFLEGVGVKITNGAIGLPQEKWGNLEVNDTWEQE
jgi:cysteinyl-tRNA synthetase